LNKKKKNQQKSKGSSTGEYSYFKEWKGLEIMFHVSTLLPFEQANLQQLARKRHIGNV